MLHTDFSTLDFSKYKRLVVIGCSFTQWHWPMWADVIHKQNPHLELVNYGCGGMGNIYIMNVLSQLVLADRINKDDIVGIMWSSFHRNDHYRHTDSLRDPIMDHTKDYCDENRIGSMTSWRSAGDMIATHWEVNKSLCDDRGFLIRDCGFIHNTTEMLKAADFDSFQMLSIGLREQVIYDESIVMTYKEDVYKLYEPYIEKHCIGGPFFSVELNNKFDETVWWVPAWIDPAQAKKEPPHMDHHPSTVRWCNYLDKIGYTVNPEVREWAEQCDNRVQNTKHALKLVVDRNWPWNSMRTETGFLPV